MQDGQPLGEQHYWGLMVAMEKIERGKHRVDIKSLKPKDTGSLEDVTGNVVLFARAGWPATPAACLLRAGGYIVRYEHGKRSPGRPIFKGQLSGAAQWGPRALPYTLQYPNFGGSSWADSSQQQRDTLLDYIGKFMGRVEAAFSATRQVQSLEDKRAQVGATGVSATGGNLTADAAAPPVVTASAANARGMLQLGLGGSGWRDIVDEGAFIDYFLATELTKNPDGYRGSVYMSKVTPGSAVAAWVS
eukprot:366462-Chlamydomonas_euryale.AAC.28